VAPGRIALFVRSERQLERAVAVTAGAGIPHLVLDGTPTDDIEKIHIATMHLAKGLEYKAVAVLACDDDAIPDPERLLEVTDPGEMQELLETERHLLYVACTRARERLFVSGVKPVSEFLRDLGAERDW